MNSIVETILVLSSGIFFIGKHFRLVKLLQIIRTLRDTDILLTYYIFLSFSTVLLKTRIVFQSQCTNRIIHFILLASKLPI